MPLHPPMMTLAFGVDDLIFIVVTLVVIGGWIGNALKAMNKKGPQAPQGRAQRTPSTSSSTSVPSLDDLALQRRRQLQELAQRRGQVSVDKPPQPTNLTAAEHGRRSDAQARYEARAAQLRRDAEAAQRRQAEAMAQQRRRIEQARRQAQGQPQPQARGQRPTQGRQQAPPAQQRTQAPPRPRQAKPSLRPTLTSSIEDAHEYIDIGESVAHRHVPDAPLPTVVKSGVAPWIGQALRGRSLRQAMVLKEVLDPPLALRRPTDPANLG